MSLISLSKMLKVARKNKFAVGSFNAIDSHFVDSIFAAAEKNSSPIIISIAEVHLKHISIEDMAFYVKMKAVSANIPVTLNLDHGLTIETVQKALDVGFTSIMFDGSHLDYDENVRLTALVSKMCKKYGASLEGELGAVGGDEGGALDGKADSMFYTPVDKTKDYIEKTNVNALAVAIGNSHGRYKGVPKLDFDRLEELNNISTVPLVLHGGSGLSTGDFQKAIELGIAKINFFTGMSQAAITSINENIKNPDLEKQYDHYLLMMKRVQSEITVTVTEQMEIFGSVNKKGFYESVS
jgi:fructose-bisphosphate aldolase, class II